VLWGFGFAGIWLNQMPSAGIFEVISKVIPHYWANNAFLDLFVRGQGLADIMPSILVLLGFTVVFFAIGLWRFDFYKA
jgi:ABC-2 type transport system permease protein